MGDTTYNDDPTIADDAALWRRIPPWHLVEDKNLGGVKASSAAFDNDPNGDPMSVVLEYLVSGSQRGPDDILRGHEGFGLKSFTAKLARDCAPSQSVCRDPLPEEPAHALVAGRKTKGVMRRLATGSTWIVGPSGAI